MYDIIYIYIHIILQINIINLIYLIDNIYLCFFANQATPHSSPTRRGQRRAQPWNQLRGKGHKMWGPLGNDYQWIYP